MFARSSKKKCRVLFAEYLGMNCNKKDKNMPFNIKFFFPQYFKINLFPIGLFAPLYKCSWFCFLEFCLKTLKKEELNFLSK